MKKNTYEDISRKIWFSLLVKGNCLNLYNDHIVSEKYIKLLKDENFNIYYFDCNEWIDLESFENEYLKKLKIDKNAYYSVFPEEEGNVFIFRSFENFFIDNHKEAIKILELMIELSWQYLLFEKKLLVLLNVKNSEINQKLLKEKGSKIKRICWLNNCSSQVGE